MLHTKYFRIYIKKIKQLVFIICKGIMEKKTKKVKVFTKRTNKQSKKNNEISVIKNLQSKYNEIKSVGIKKFNELPLSPATLKGLHECGYHKPTDIQQATIGLALQGKDILGAAETGSGKTLAFLIPVLEHLFCKQWSQLDGLGALIITPTRELAYQIFETLRRIGGYHDFSAGLIIGGKDLKFERNRMDQCNIVICTPGRLLQHMDENPLFNCDNMQILILDEADRCLDMGFEQTMNAIIANLPPKRQTLLFSATQTRSVRDLARLSLKDPQYVSVYRKQVDDNDDNNKNDGSALFTTPKELRQSYVVCELKDKISILWSFIKSHLKQKIIVFLSSCKQVKYIYEIFCKLRPGTSLLALYGSLHQLRRMEIYESFCRKINGGAVLFATDLAARGLDFPQVNWVVQIDCPEDVATYIHRVGRTARYHRGGESLLVLLESERTFVDKLQQHKIPIDLIQINPTKQTNPVRKMEAFLAKDPVLKETAQRAFVAYVKAVFLMRDKDVFNVHALDTESFAHSLGLAIPPRIRFLQRLNKQKSSRQNHSIHIQQANKKIYFQDSDNTSDNDEKVVFGAEQQIDNKFNNNNRFETYDNSSDDDDNDDIFTVKRLNHDIEPISNEEMQQLQLNPKKKAVTKAAVAKKILKKNIVVNKKIIFTDAGESLTVRGAAEMKSEAGRQYENEGDGGIDIERARLVMQEEDKFDKQLFREKVKAKHKEEKRKQKQLKRKRKEQFEETDNDVDHQQEDDSEEEEEVDLSWLPDPDRIYGKEENDGDDEQKTQVKLEEKKEPKLNKKKKRKIDKMSTKELSVNEAEKLALMLLNKS